MLSWHKIKENINSWMELWPFQILYTGSWYQIVRVIPSENMQDYFSYPYVYRVCKKTKKLSYKLPLVIHSPVAGGEQSQCHGCCCCLCCCCSCLLFFFYWQQHRRKRWAAASLILCALAFFPWAKSDQGTAWDRWVDGQTWDAAQHSKWALQSALMLGGDNPQVSNHCPREFVAKVRLEPRKSIHILISITLLYTVSTWLCTETQKINTKHLLGSFEIPFWFQRTMELVWPAQRGFEHNNIQMCTCSQWHS